MDEDKFYAVISRTKRDNSRFSELIKYYYRDEYFSNRNTIFVSIFFSSFLTYKYLKNTILYRENNGHFNSPQNLLNRKLTKNYLIEGGFRFILNSLGLFLCLNLFKFYYLKIDEPLFLWNPEEEQEIKKKKDLEDIILIEEELKQENKEKIFKVGIDETEEKINQNFAKSLFSIDKSLGFRNNINKYFEQYKKNK